MAWRSWRTSLRIHIGTLKTRQFVVQGKFFLRESIIDQTYKVDEKVAAVLLGTVHYIFGALTSKGNISSSIEWTWANISISLTFLQLACYVLLLIALNWNFCLKIRSEKRYNIFCLKRVWSQCMMGNSKIAENGLKNYWGGIFL